MSILHKKIYVKSILVVILLLLTGYHSVYFESLSGYKEKLNSQIFDPQAYARNFWDHILPEILNDALDMTRLLSLIQSDLQQTIDLHGGTVGVSKTHAFLVKGAGRIVNINQDSFDLVLNQTENGDITIQTDYIFGNAIRDAARIIKVSDFSSTMEFNAISNEINNIVLTEVIPSFNDKIEIGNTLKFFGAIEINENNTNFSSLQIVPISVTYD